MDTSNADARRALKATLTQFQAWRLDLARYSARAERRLSDADRNCILDRCDSVDKEVLAARIDLILALGEAPQKLAGHSRVVDVERALDNIEAASAELRRKLSHGAPADRFDGWQLRP